MATLPPYPSPYPPPYARKYLPKYSPPSRKTKMPRPTGLRPRAPVTQQQQLSREETPSLRDTLWHSAYVRSKRQNPELMDTFEWILVRRLPHFCVKPDKLNDLRRNSARLGPVSHRWKAMSYLVMHTLEEHATISPVHRPGGLDYVPDVLNRVAWTWTMVKDMLEEDSRGNIIAWRYQRRLMESMVDFLVAVITFLAQAIKWHWRRPATKVLRGMLLVDDWKFSHGKKLIWDRMDALRHYREVCQLMDKSHPRSHKGQKIVSSWPK